MSDTAVFDKAIRCHHIILHYEFRYLSCTLFIVKPPNTNNGKLPNLPLVNKLQAGFYMASLGEKRPGFAAL